MTTNIINFSDLNAVFLLNSLVYFISAFILLFLGKLVFQLMNPRYKVNLEMVEKDNLAFAVAQVGYYIGLLFTIGLAVKGESLGLVNDLLAIGLYGIMGIVLLNLAIKINDWLILSKFKVQKEIVDDQNVGTGVVVAASAIATGIIIYHALGMEWVNIWITLIYWVFAQIILIVTAWVYNLIVPYSIHEHIEKDNIAVGIGFAGALVALAIIISYSITDILTGWKDIILVLIYTIIGLIFLPVARFLTDRILLPGRKLTDEIINQEKPNVGVALIEAFAYIGGAFLITWVL